MNKQYSMDYKVKAFRNWSKVLYLVARDRLSGKYRSIYIDGAGEISITMQEYESLEDMRKHCPPEEQLFDIHITIPNNVGPK